MLIKSLWQFPIKGVGGTSINHTALAIDQTLPGDRRYALSAGSKRAALAGDNVWLKKAHFLQLMERESLAALSCRIEGDKVYISGGNTSDFSGNLTNPCDLAKCQSFMSSFLQLPNTSDLCIHRIENGAYTDQTEPFISIGGSASLAAFADATHTRIDARRFRLNIILSTETAFVENQWIGSKVKIGEAVIKIVDHVGRCAAINVNPATAKREPNYLPAMRQYFGHSNLGVFGRVVRHGKLSRGDAAVLIKPV